VGPKLVPVGSRSAGDAAAAAAAAGIPAYPLSFPPALLPLSEPVAVDDASAVMSFERYRLRMSPRWMTLEPADSTLQVRQVLFIDRTSCEVSLRERLEVAALSKATSDEIVYGLVGIANSYIDRYVAAACLALVSSLVCHAFFTQSCMNSLPFWGLC